MDWRLGLSLLFPLSDWWVEPWSIVGSTRPSMEPRSGFTPTRPDRPIIRR